MTRVKILVIDHAIGHRPPRVHCPSLPQKTLVPPASSSLPESITATLASTDPKMPDSTIELQPREGFDAFSTQLFSVTEIPAEQQRVFLNSVSLGAVEPSTFEQYMRAFSMVREEDRRVYVLGNFSGEDDCFEFNCQGFLAEDQQAAAQR